MVEVLLVLQLESLPLVLPLEELVVESSLSLSLLVSLVALSGEGCR